jgi:hypothetical protein
MGFNRLWYQVTKFLQALQEEEADVGQRQYASE